jgi:hypothetical protein
MVQWRLGRLKSAALKQRRDTPECGRQRDRSRLLNFYRRLSPPVVVPRIVPYDPTAVPVFASTKDTP